MVRNGARLILPLLLVALSACGGSGVSASTCDEVVDETIALFQRLIDDVDAQFADLTVEEFLATADDLPSLESFEKDADRIDEIAADLGCTQGEISATVAARIGELRATTDVGRFIISALRSGGL
jgi:hypothetical protein